MRLIEYSFLFVMSVSGITADFTIMRNIDLGETRVVPAWNETCQCINDPKTPSTIGDPTGYHFQVAGGLCDVGVIDLGVSNSLIWQWKAYFDTDPTETSVGTCNEQNGAWEIHCGGEVGLWTRSIYCAASGVCPGWLTD